MLEAYIVAARRGFLPQMEDLLDGFGVEVVSVTADSAIRAAEAYRRFGKGFHPAKLNFGDCFAYELARSRDCPLLYVGEDFAGTDVRGAITAAP
jgi:ribonuclease VapC